MPKTPDNKAETMPAQTTADRFKHHLRTSLAALLGIVALLLLFITIIGTWVDHTLTNTTAYVNAVSPLASKPAVQKFVTDQVTNDLFNNGKPAEIAPQLLSAQQIAGKSQAQLNSEVKQAIRKEVSQIVSSPSFSALWRSTNQSASQQLNSELNSNSPTLQLNFHPAVTGVIDQLNSTKLAALLGKTKLSSDTGKVSVKGDQVKNIRSFYKDLKNGVIAGILAVLIISGLSVLASHNRQRTVWRLILWGGLVFLLVALIAKIPSFLVSTSSSNTQQQAVVVIISTLLRSLFIDSLVLGLVLVIAYLSNRFYFSSHPLSFKHSASAKD